MLQYIYIAVITAFLALGYYTSELNSQLEREKGLLHQCSQDLATLERLKNAEVERERAKARVVTLHKQIADKTEKEVEEKASTGKTFTILASPRKDYNEENDTYEFGSGKPTNGLLPDVTTQALPQSTN